MLEIRGSILNTLKNRLNNRQITIEYKQIEHHGNVKILSRREQFEQMEKDYPVVSKLAELFDLELA
jgi:DNA polymerase-3 subunit gamma/tau